MNPGIPPVKTLVALTFLALLPLDSLGHHRPDHNPPGNNDGNPPPGPPIDDGCPPGRDNQGDNETPGQGNPCEPTSEPPTSEPPTSEPPTSEPPTSEPPTSEPPTSEPPTSEPPTSEPPTSEPPTSEPPTSEPPTSEPPTSEPPISEPPTSEPPTSEPPTSEPPTSEPPTSEPPTSEPPTSEPPTSEPPTSEPPTSEPPTSEPPTSEPPTSEPPTSEPPTSEPPTSEPPVTDPPISEPPDPGNGQGNPVSLANRTDPDGYDVASNVTRNQLGVALHLDEVCQLHGDDSEFGRLCQSLADDTTTARQVAEALRYLTPSAHAAFRKVVRQNAWANLAIARQRVASFHSGRDDVGLLDNSTPAYGASSIPRDVLLIPLGGAAGGDETDNFGNLGLYFRAEIIRGSQDQTQNENAFDQDGRNFTVGADYRINDNMFAGASVTFGQTDVDFGRNVGEIDADNTLISLYGSYYNASNLYIDGIISFGRTDFSSERNIDYEDASGTVNRHAKGDTDSDDFSVSVNTGYTFFYKGFNIDPVVRFYHLNTSIDGFRERGAGGWNAAFDSQDFESTIVGASVQVSRNLLMEWGVVTPFARLEFNHEFEDDSQGVDYRFVDDVSGIRLNYTLDDPKSNYVTWVLGASAQFTHGISGFATFENYESYDDFDTDVFTVGLRWQTTF